ncbi:MAG: allene oxide cyclase barrel-like domain-containing protein [Nocardioidaceae bacterium]
MNITRNKRAGAAAVAAAVALPVTFLALQPTNAASTTGPDSFRLVERGGTFKFVDIPPKQKSDRDPPTAGDELIFTSKLFRHGKRVGTLHAVCTVTRAAPPNRTPAVCTGGLVLREGTITLTFVGALKDKIEIAITGGTGRYAGASGTVTSESKGRISIDTVHLQ